MPGVTQATRGAPSTHTVQHPHWPWGLQPSLARAATQAVAQDLEQRGAVVGDLDVDPVDAERERRRRLGAPVRWSGQLKDEPHPQVRVALGFEMWNPAPCRPSVYSRVEPFSSSALAASTTTLTGPNGRTTSSSDELGVEEHLVAVARAAPGAHGHPQGQGVVALLGEQVGDLGHGTVGQRDRARLPPMLTELIVVTAHASCRSWPPGPTHAGHRARVPAPTTVSRARPDRRPRRRVARAGRAVSDQVTGRIGGVPAPSSPPAEETVRAALLGVDRPRARRQHRRPRHGAGRRASPPTAGSTVEVALTVAGCPLRTQLTADVETRVGSLPGVSAVEVVMGEMDAAERGALMDRARRQGPGGPGRGHRHPRHGPGAGGVVGQGRAWASRRSPSTWPWPWPAGASSSASSTPTSGASRSPACSACRASCAAEGKKIVPLEKPVGPGPAQGGVDGIPRRRGLRHHVAGPHPEPGRAAVPGGRALGSARLPAHRHAPRAPATSRWAWPACCPAPRSWW